MEALLEPDQNSRARSAGALESGRGAVWERKWIISFTDRLRGGGMVERGKRERVEWSGERESIIDPACLPFGLFATPCRYYRKGGEKDAMHIQSFTYRFL